MTLTLNDFLKFSINLIDDNNKEIEFASNKKNASFQILKLMYS